jgi:uncharacterized membrane protein YbhN (UPF0104 family)
MEAGPAPAPAMPSRFRLPPSRWIALLVSALVLILICRRVDTALLWKTISSSAWGWWLMGFVLFGASLTLQAWRWHNMLELVGEAVHFRTSLRLTFIGHCFSALMFGALVSDVMKAGLYAKWHRRQTASILAASALDRFLGGISTALYAMLTLAIGLQSGLHLPTLNQPSKNSSFSLQWLWLLLPIALLIYALMRWRHLWMRHWIEARNRFAQGMNALRNQKAKAVLLIVAGMFVQLFISAVLGMSLRAVFTADLPWLGLLWTFPVIGVIASLPVTVSGAGARDAAAILIWGMFGIAQVTSLSATLLTLAVNLGWALIGGLLLWRSTPRSTKTPGAGTVL